MSKKGTVSEIRYLKGRYLFRSKSRNSSKMRVMKSLLAAKIVLIKLLFNRKRANLMKMDSLKGHRSSTLILKAKL